MFRPCHRIRNDYVVGTGMFGREAAVIQATRDRTLGAHAASGAYLLLGALDLGSAAVNKKFNTSDIAAVV
jgi:hypothetical protein